jgi:V/A-type H+-transporting ATPase subunit E
MGELEAILEKEILSDISHILAQADSRSKEMIEEARREASARLSACRRRLEMQTRAAEQRAASGAELTLSTACMKAKGEVMEAVRERVLTALSRMPSQPRYGEILEALAEEALTPVKGAKSVVAHPDDRERLAEWARRKGLELLEDPAVRLGVRIVAGNGRTVINTLPTRFQRAWDGLASEVATLLWE